LVLVISPRHLNVLGFCISVILKKKEMKKKLSNNKTEKTEEKKVVIQDDQKFLVGLEKSNARHLNLKQLLNNYYATKK
jgi:ABC-type Fe3+-citrate transport system substrate-binding protein